MDENLEAKPARVSVPIEAIVGIGALALGAVTGFAGFVIDTANRTFINHTKLPEFVTDSNFNPGKEVMIGGAVAALGGMALWFRGLRKWVDREQQARQPENP